VLARLPLRSKLVLVVSVPLFVILGFAGFGIANRLDDLEGQRQYGRLRFPNDALVELQDAVSTEGVLTAWYVASGGDQEMRVQLGRARALTDGAAAVVSDAGRTLTEADVSPTTKRAWDELEVRLDTLPTLRRQADDRAGLPNAFADRYGEMAANAVDVSARLARDVTDRRLSASMLAIVELRREQVTAADEAMIVVAYLASGASTQFGDWVTAVGLQDDNVAAFRATGSADERAAFEQARRRMPRDRFREAAGTSPTKFPGVSITAAQGYDSWHERQRARSAALASVQGVVDGTAASLESDALRAVLGYGLGVSLLVLLVLVLAWVMVRSVNRSLRSLTDAARDVAEHQLPNLVASIQRGGQTPHADAAPPLTVASKDEIGALARAFNTIRETTLRVAEEQAVLLRKGIGDLYVNLARRNQSLVDRQIALLDVLEGRAEDPDQLASLFELDHLATRMRRNAESLLVLSGAGQSRQWAEAIPIVDVVRAASAEIADFARVSFVGFDGDVSVAGNAVADVTHILAELLENATTFSPPGTPVVVAGMLAERRFVVSITDEGIGMDETHLAAANALLQQPPLPGLSLSRTLGLHVVAHLANRYGIRVQLRRAATNGVTAIIALPATVLTRPAPPAPAAPAAGSVAPTAPETVAAAETANTEWPHPEVVPPAFDPALATPRGATPVGVEHPSVVDPSGLPRRSVGGNGRGGTGPGDGLPQRDPGSHLSHRPEDNVPEREHEPKPRPEQVHHLLTEHLRGIRDGRSDGRPAGVGTRSPDAEDLQ
jgi:HAMP domain-containing protein/anti-sigma regulatory factor (Ser/Thr protein kinase)